MSGTVCACARALNSVPYVLGAIAGVRTAHSSLPILTSELAREGTPTRRRDLVQGGVIFAAAVDPALGWGRATGLMEACEALSRKGMWDCDLLFAESQRPAQSTQYNQAVGVSLVGPLFLRLIQGSDTPSFKLTAFVPGS